MFIERAICFSACVAFSGVLNAQTCSGGVTGGMDATGNECNEAIVEFDHLRDQRAVFPPVATTGKASPMDNATVSAGARRANFHPASTSGAAASRDDGRSTRMSAQPASFAARKSSADPSKP